MKKPLLLIIVFLFGTFSVFAQTADTLENPGFERWEVPIGLSDNNPEPVNWSGIKTSDNSSVNPLAPVNWARCDTAHSGKYSLKLFNISSLGLVATGTMSNGRYHTEVSNTKSYVYTDTANALWHTRFTARPDSIVGWFMCKPVKGDHGNVLAILHTGFAETPLVNADSSTWIAKASFDLPDTEVAEWTRFSAPFKYYSDKTPEFILIVLTSGNGADALAGSVAYFDDLDVVFNSTGIPVHPKGDLRVYAYKKEIHVQLDQVPPGLYTVRVLNILGRVEYSIKIQNGEKKIIHTNLPAGIYLVQAVQGNNNIVKKIMIR
ncbi:T9SS type A sorting domain-containing protein [Candidatus Sulfidibacterium hydrothermale]|uniref:T9SS type A sorting domain-containing protein n=1 Tax=Candidatus Sulfidibacterium hydrothermale TaxID=2875962 RepID=UPI001F0A379F|nr:T9SS type A sorting domain-containing protein [Candidatus Sulfidibacterium hydrothermale]UBM63418.1 T9SS type A sorting domain-containing protein [Candidatus Sulfidibacterium hydrothermale]